MRKRRATLVHINPMEAVTPLAGGYLKTFAEIESEVRNSWDIELYSTTTDCPASEIIRDLFSRAPDLVGFSTYVWNIGLVTRLLQALRGLLPTDVQYLLGGVQVMSCAPEYVDRTWENVLVCNGEGEKTFRELLLQLTTNAPDLTAVGGLTFQRDGEHITTNPHPRIRDLEEIPSPYLSGVFEQKDLAIALLETNRGCPYHCEYCFWGGAIGQKINRLGGDRISEEIAYLAARRCRAVLVCDANFGVFPHDLEVARQFVDSKRSTGYPLRVTYSSAKNNPDRVSQIATILANGGVLSSQPISLQTMNPRALEFAKRGNISTDTYLKLQRKMNEIRVPSFIEMIWPLPGETLESFKQGIQDLCHMGAQVFMVYPLIWLKNVGYEGKEAELGIVTLEEADPVGGGRVAIQTKDVSFEQWIAGMIFTNSVMLLYDCRGLFHTSGILSSLGIESYRGIFDRFIGSMETASINPIVDLWKQGGQNFEDMYKYTWRGAVVESVLHGNRTEFDVMLTQFVSSISELIDDEYSDLLSAAVEFDILNRPYAFANTPVEIGIDPTYLKIVDQGDRTLTVNSPFNFPAISEKLVTLGSVDRSTLQPDPVQIRLDHKRGQIFRMPYRRDEDHHQFCHQFVAEIGNHLPVLETIPLSGAVGTNRV